MMNTKICRFDIDNYKQQISSAVSRKFYQETSHIVGLVSPIIQDMAFYYDEFSVHQFELSAWRANSDDEVVREGLTVYRVVKGGADQDALFDIPLLSYIQANVHLDKKSKYAIFCDGEILSLAPDQNFEDKKDKLKSMHEIFSNIECAYQNKYEATLNWNDNSVRCDFDPGRRLPISKFLLRAFNIVEPRKTFYHTIEKIALDELFELKQRGWFAESGYVENDFKSEMATGKLDALIFEERRFSVWYSADQLFDGYRIVFDGSYNDGVSSVRLFGNVNDKDTLLNKRRPSVKTERFGTFYADLLSTKFSAKIPWLNTHITLSLSSVRGTIDQRELNIAEAIFQNQQDWHNRAYKYAIDSFLELKNDSWRQSDEPLIGVEEFKALLGDFSISFCQHDPYEFSIYFTTDNSLFAGHGVVISGSLEDGFTHNELIG